MIYYPVLNYLNGRIRYELKRPHNEKKHAHNIPVTSKHLGQRQPSFGLNLVLIEAIRSQEFDKDHGNWRKRKDQKEKENVVAVEKVIRFISRVVIPERLSERQVPTESGGGVFDCCVGQHFGEDPNAGGAWGGGDRRVTVVVCAFVRV